MDGGVGDRTESVNAGRLRRREIHARRAELKYSEGRGSADSATLNSGYST